MPPGRATTRQDRCRSSAPQEAPRDEPPRELSRGCPTRPRSVSGRIERLSGRISGPQPPGGSWRRPPRRLRAMPPCRHCGVDTDARRSSASSCGSAIGPDGPARTRESRRVVTVLFSDIVGSTALGELLDPETLRGVMVRYFATMSAVIERHGGTVEKYIGDAIMAVFGLPLVHEDDALRAVRAAAEMREALATLNAALRDDLGVTIATRTGIETGEVVAGDASARQTLVTGDTVNTAARLEQAAGPGEILLGRLTARLVVDAVTVESIPPVWAKGKAGPVWAVRLVAVDQRGRQRVPSELRRSSVATASLDVSSPSSRGYCRIEIRRSSRSWGRPASARAASSRSSSRAWRTGRPCSGDAASPTAKASPIGPSARSCSRQPGSPREMRRKPAGVSSTSWSVMPATGRCWPRASRVRSGYQPSRRPRRSSSGPPGGPSSTWRRSGRSSWSSRISTGPSRRSSSSSTSSSNSGAPSRCSSSALPVREVRDRPGMGTRSTERN